MDAERGCVDDTPAGATGSPKALGPLRKGLGGNRLRKDLTIPLLYGIHIPAMQIIQMRSAECGGGRVRARGLQPGMRVEVRAVFFADVVPGLGVRISGVKRFATTMLVVC